VGVFRLNCGRLPFQDEAVGGEFGLSSAKLEEVTEAFAEVEPTRDRPEIILLIQVDMDALLGGATRQD